MGEQDAQGNGCSTSSCNPPRHRVIKGRAPLRSSNWADRMSKDGEEMDYTEMSKFPDLDAEEGKNLLESKCTQSVSNNKQRKLKAKYPQTKVLATRTPKLDDCLKQVIQTATKSNSTIH